MRRCSVRSPRWTRKQSNGPGTAPTAFCTKRSRSSQPSSRVTTTPPTVSEWPPRYFVVECTAKSAPSASGCWLAGVAKVLSTATSGCADAARATATTPSTSMTSSVGFVGVSTQTSRVSGRIARGDGVEVGLVDEVVGQPPARQHLVDEPVGPAVEVARQDDVRAGLGRRR